MAGELKGKNWRTAGSDDYFVTLNRELRINFMGGGPREYYKTLSECGKNGAAVIEKIYEDLKSAAPVVRYFLEDSRKNLISFIRGAEAVMKITGASCSDADKCVDYLELKASEVRLSSGLSQYNVDAAAKELCGKLRKEEAAALLEAAKKNGIEYAARGNSMYYNLLTQTFSGSRRNLMADVFYKLDYDYNKSRYKGKKSGKDMASGDYISWAEEGVFGKKVGENLRYDYKKIIMQDLQAIGDAIKRDVEDGGKNGNYISTSNAALMRAGAASIMWCGVTGLDEIGRDVDKLTKYVSKDEEYAEHMKEIQEILDVLGMHGALLTFEVEEVMTPERFEEIGRLCRQLNFEYLWTKAVEIAQEVVRYRMYENSVHVGYHKFVTEDMDLLKKYEKIDKICIAITIGLAIFEVMPQILRDIGDDNDTIEDKTIEDVVEVAFETAFSILASMGMAKLGGFIGWIICPPMGAVVGYVAGTIFGDWLGSMIGKYTGDIAADKLIEARGQDNDLAYS